MEEKVVQKMKLLIDSAGLKHYHVAEKMGLSKEQLSFIFQGRKRVTCDIIVNFCSVLGVTPNELFDYK